MYGRIFENIFGESIVHQQCFLRKNRKGIFQEIDYQHRRQKPRVRLPPTPIGPIPDRSSSNYDDSACEDTLDERQRCRRVEIQRYDECRKY